MERVELGTGRGTMRCAPPRGARGHPSHRRVRHGGLPSPITPAAPRTARGCDCPRSTWSVRSSACPSTWDSSRRGRARSSTPRCRRSRRMTPPCSCRRRCGRRNRRENETDVRPARRKGVEAGVSCIVGCVRPHRSRDGGRAGHVRPDACFAAGASPDHRRDSPVAPMPRRSAAGAGAGSRRASGEVAARVMAASLSSGVDAAGPPREAGAERDRPRRGGMHRRERRARRAACVVGRGRANQATRLVPRGAQDRPLVFVPWQRSASRGNGLRGRPPPWMERQLARVGAAAGGVGSGARHASRSVVRAHQRGRSALRRPLRGWSQARSLDVQNELRRTGAARALCFESSRRSVRVGASGG